MLWLARKHEVGQANDLEQCDFLLAKQGRPELWAKFLWVEASVLKKEDALRKKLNKVVLLSGRETC
jgi:hypothetical protein